MHGSAWWRYKPVFASQCEVRRTGGRPGLWVASGHYCNGVALAPGTAEIMSRWMLGEQPELDMSDFRIERTTNNDAKLGFSESADSSNRSSCSS